MASFLAGLFGGRSSGGAPAVWEWEDGSRGSGQWKTYDPSSTAALEAGHASGSATVTLTFGRTAYIVDVRGMRQTNTRTSYARTIRRRGGGAAAAAAPAPPAAAAASAGSAAPSSAAVWEWEDGSRGSGRWKRYDPTSTATLEAGHASGTATLTLTFGSTAYTVDVRGMSQTNTRTSYARNIRRNGASSARKKARKSKSKKGRGGGSSAAPPGFTGSHYFTVGDAVRVKATVSSPAYGWGAVTPGMEGTITSIRPPDCVVDFPSGNSGWSGRLDEMEPAAPPLAVGDAVRLKAWVTLPVDGSWGDVTHADVGTVVTVDASGVPLFDFPRAAGSTLSGVSAVTLDAPLDVGDCVQIRAGIAPPRGISAGSVGIIAALGVVSRSQGTMVVDWGERRGVTSRNDHLERAGFPLDPRLNDLLAMSGGGACDGAVRPPPVDEALALGFPPLPDQIDYAAGAPDPDWASLTRWTVLTPNAAHDGVDLTQYDPAALSVVTGEALGSADVVVRLPCHTAHTPCIFLRDNIERSLAINGMCMCKRRWRVRGQQPDGSMSVSRSSSPCSGYAGFGTIRIEYSLPAGTQLTCHPHPGVGYSGTRRACYLPDNAEGRAALRLLKRAFQNGLLFRVGKSITNGEDNTTVWGSIHQKTSDSGGATSHGWPDPGYFNRLQSECAVVGLLTEQFLQDELDSAAKVAATAAAAAAADSASSGASAGASASAGGAASKVAAAPSAATVATLASLEAEYATVQKAIKLAKSDRSKLMKLMKQKKTLRKRIKAAKAL